MRKAVLSIALMSLMSAPMVFAQGPGGGRNGRVPNIATRVQREVNRLTNLLDLNPGEQTQLTDLLTKVETSNQTLMGSMRTAQKDLRTAETNNDSAGIQSASTQIGTITGEITANRANLNAGIAQILRPDQLTKYKQLGPRGGFGGGGFGGGRRFGGPPPAGPGGPGSAQ